MKTRVLCNDCTHFDRIPQVCCLNPLPVKKDPSNWCHQAYPDYEIDPGVARLYVGLLKTIRRHVNGLLEDQDSLEGRIPNLTAWATQADKVLSEDPTPQGTITLGFQAHPPGDDQPKDSTFVVGPPIKKYRAMLNTGFGMQPIDVNSADELAKAAVYIASDIRLDPNSLDDEGEPLDKTSFPFQFSAIDGSTKGWFGMLHYEWSIEPIPDGVKFDDCYYRATFENTSAEEQRDVLPDNSKP